jgi:hypothetical protein
VRFEEIMGREGLDEETKDIAKKAAEEMVRIVEEERKRKEVEGAECDDM